MTITNEVIELNNHRLLNGDATRKEDVSKLIGDSKINLLLTDPPYGINIVDINSETEDGKITGTVGSPAAPRFKDAQGTVGTRGIVEPRRYKPILGDDKPFNPRHLLDLNIPSIIFGANNFSHELPNNSKWLVWFKKSNLNIKRNNFSDVELCWTNLKGKACYLYHHTWSGMLREGNRNEELIERVHPTQKPVGLLEQIILEFTEPGDIILDLYGGSGSTLIACEKTDRKCFMMELSSDYCEIIEKRYWDYIGNGQTKLV